MFSDLLDLRSLLGFLTDVKFPLITQESATMMKLILLLLLLL